MVNLTNSTLSTLTRTETWIQLVFFYVFLCGIVSTICSTSIWVGIWRKKKLRTRFFIIVGWLMFCRTGICVQLFIVGIHRIFRLCDMASTAQPRLICIFMHLWLYNGPTLELSLLCTLVIDRMIAILRTAHYRVLSKKSAFQTCLGQFVLISGIKWIPAIQDDPTLIGLCIDYNSFLSPLYNRASKAIDIILSALMIVLYLILISIVHQRGKMLDNTTENEAVRASLKRQLELVPILRNLVFLHCGLSTVSRIFLFASSVVPPEHSERMVAIGGAMVCVDIFVNSLYLLISDRRVRKAAFTFTSKNTIAVVPFKAAPAINAVCLRVPNGVG